MASGEVVIKLKAVLEGCIPDRPARAEVNKFWVANVDGLPAGKDQFEAVVKWSRFDTYEAAKASAQGVAQLLTGDLDDGSELEQTVLGTAQLVQDAADSAAGAA